MKLSRFYPILDAGLLRQEHADIREFADALRDAGVTLLQYRDKSGSPQSILAAAAVLRAAFAGTSARLIMNDRADLTVLACFDGVHVGQTDLAPADARLVLSSSGTVIGPAKIVGVSTHTDAQVRLADQSPADYLAIGPIFSTSTKPDAEQPVGLEGIRRARALTAKPLVAIGGITRASAAAVLAAGADSIAVISALFSPNESIEEVARDFLRILR